MFPKFVAIAVLALFAVIGQSEAQDGCVAQPVNSLWVAANHMLSWSAGSNEECEITEYLVFIWEALGPKEFSFSVNSTWADVSFLEVCEEWVFVVIPVSHHTLGRDRRIISELPLPLDADISISYFNVTTNVTTDETYLQWGLNDPSYANCSMQYRVTIEVEGDPLIESIFVADTSLNLHFLAPCSSYQFGVRAIHVSRPTVEGPLKLAYWRIPGHSQGPPTITHLEQGARWANLTFRFESRVRNPCRIMYFYVDGGNSFQKTIVYEDDDNRRQPVNVSITALQPNSMYFIESYVRNEAGWSIPNRAAFQTLEED